MDNLEDIASDALARLGAIEEAAQTNGQATKVARAKALDHFLTALAASGEVSIIVVRAYTPWQEDEPQHVADFFVNVKEIITEGIEDDNCGLDLPADMVGGIEAEARWNESMKRMVSSPGAHEANIELCASHGHVYDPPSETVRAEIENETDYFVSYVLAEGQFEVVRGAYAYSE